MSYNSNLDFVFHPTTFGMSKNEIVEMIDDRVEDFGDYTDENESWAFRWTQFKDKQIDVTKLSDDLTQAFVNEWYDTFEYWSVKFDVETAGMKQEDVLFELAQKLY